MAQAPRFVPQSIKDTGIEVHLDKNYAAKGGYAEFYKRHVTLHEPKTIIAKAFGVDRQTVTSWINQYENEKEANRG